MILGLFVVRTLTSSSTPPELGGAEKRAMAAAWLSDGAAAVGGRRAADGVTAAVEGVARSLLPALGGVVDPATFRIAIVATDDGGTLFALPDGTLVVDQALLRRMRSEGELAALMAHAFAHLVRGDVAQQLAPALKDVRASLTAGAGATAAAALSRALGQRFNEETELLADEHAARILRTAGWASRHYGRGLERALEVPAVPWAVQHAVHANRAAPFARAPDGRAGAEDYDRAVLQPLGAATSAARP